MIWQLMIKAYCELLYQDSLSLLEIQEWLIDANLATIYLLTNFLRRYLLMHK